MTRLGLPVVFAVLIALAVASPSRSTRVLADPPTPPPASPPAEPPAAPPPSTTPGTNPPVVEKDIVFGSAGGQELRLDVARPTKGTLLPTVVFLHGGGWQKGTRADGAGLIVELAERGYVAVSADYRLAPTWKFPSPVEDASCAVRFVRSKASAWNLNPLRIAAWGEGEGAYLAMMLGTLGEKEGFDGMGGHPEQSRAVQAVVSFYGPSDLSKLSAWTGAEPYLRQRYGKGSAGLLIDFLGSTDRRAPVFATASPITHVTSGDAPTLSVHGENDPVVPVEQPQAFHAALRAASVREKLVVVPGGAHALSGVERTKAIGDAVAFLDDLFGHAPESHRSTASPEPGPGAATAPGAPRVDADIVYRRLPGQELHLDLVRPAGAGPFPIAVGFHFGPYTPRARVELRDEMLWYASNGFAAASVEYRGPTTGAYPTPVEDGRAALQFLRSHAAQYGLDAGRVVVFGRNLGAWVALHLALASPSDGTPRPQAAVAGYAATDLADAAFDDNPNIGRLREILTGASPPKKEVVARASPLTYADKGDPPVLVFHSPKDLAIPISQSERLVERLKAAGCDATLFRLSGGGHGADRTPQTAADAVDLEAIRKQTIEFLRRVLRIEAPPGGR